MIMKNRARHILSTLALALLGATLLSAAQTESTLRGRITDPRGGPVPAATVTAYARDSGVRITVSADNTGSYLFESLAPGEYLVDVEAPHFSRLAAQTVRVARGSSSTLDISLQVAGVREEIVVTASGTAQTVDEVSKAISVVSREEIEARNEFAISEVLRVIPGLRVQQLGGPGSFTSIKTRGLRSEDTAVLIDGFRFRDAAAPQGDASGFIEDLIVTDVDRLEVLRGSGSSLYGSNAIGGIINLVSGEGGGRTRGSLLLEGGNLGLFRGRTQIAGGTKNDRIAYSAGVAHLNVSDGIDGDDAARNTSGQGRIRFRISPTATLSMRLYSADSFVQLNTSPDGIGTVAPSGIIDARPLSLEELRRYENGTPASQLSVGAATFIPAANNPDQSRAARFFSGSITLDHRWTESFGYSLSYQGLSADRSFADGPGGVSFQPVGGSTRSDSLGRIHTLQARFDARVRPWNLINAGYEFEQETFRNQAFQVISTNNSTARVTQRSNSLFAQDQLRFLGDRLQFSAAFRAQYFSLDNPEFTPATTAPYRGVSFTAPPDAYTGDGSIAYMFRKAGTKVRAHVGNGYRAPSLYERFGTFFGSFGYSAYGDPRLRPDRSIAFDMGLDQALLNGRLRTLATYFYTRLQELIIFDFSGVISPATDPFGRFGGYRNTRGGLARGLELSATSTPSPSLDLSVAYTYTNADQRVPLVAGVIRSFVIPDHQVSIVATQRIGRRLFVNFDFSASSNYLAPVFSSTNFSSRAYEFDGIVKADLGVSYKLPLSDTRSLRFYGKADNLFDHEYYESGFRTPGITVVSGMKFEF
jgi:iron complex outermembrane receptor protein